jgi:hypothetical protein
MFIRFLNQEPHQLFVAIFKLNFPENSLEICQFSNILNDNKCCWIHVFDGKLICFQCSTNTLHIYDLNMETNMLVRKKSIVLAMEQQCDGVGSYPRMEGKYFIWLNFDFKKL